MKKPVSATSASTSASRPGPADPADTLASIGPVARSSVVDAVADRLRNEILTERLAAGSRLPSERELSVALGVNRLTLRAALARLEAMGLVSTRHGSGTEVVPWRESAGLEALPMVLSSLDRSEPAWAEMLGSMLEVRRILVGEIVALAAERRTEDDLRAMEELAAAQQNNVDDALSYARGDIAFQRAVVRATRNVGFELVLNSLARFPEEQPALLDELYDRREDALPYYAVLIQIVRAGDGEAARSTLRAAFAAMDEDWLARHGHAKRVKAAVPRARPSKPGAKPAASPSGASPAGKKTKSR